MLALIGAEPLVVGYYDLSKQDEAADVDFSKYTHVNLAFAAPGKDGSIAFGQGISVGDAATKVKAKGAKVLVSVGGWGGSRWLSPVMANEASRTALVSSIVDTIGTNKLDGVDILWEYPGRAGSSCYAFDANNDTPNYLTFLQSLREQLNLKFSSDKKLITVGVPVEPFNLKSGPSTDVSGFAKAVDYAHLMPFGNNGGWQNTTAPNAPFNFEANKGAPYSFVSAIDAWTTAGWPADQLTGGISFSGRSAVTVMSMADEPTNQYQKQFSKPSQGDPEDDYWKDPCTGDMSVSGQWQYKYLRSLGKLSTPTTAASTIVRQWDDISKTPWLFNSTDNTFYSYDDQQSIKVKVDYAASKGMAGTMVWLLHMDYQNELLGAINGNSSTSSTSSTNIISSTNSTKPAKACTKRKGNHRRSQRHSRNRHRDL
ncbi:hypothetical protein IWW50_000284 [Coemansia erecta]|nr:hypothetical protein IWW50_000284 [Coemansia erecta]